jgi:simple sugar transport system permease protein
MYNRGVPPFLIVLISILAAFVGGLLMGAIYCLLTVTLKANQNVTGLAMTIFGAGLTKYIMNKMAISAFKYLYAKDFFRFPFAKSTTSLKYCGIMVFLAIAIALIASYVLTRTQVGLHLRAVGENPATADAVGINVTKYKYVATLIGSGIAALGGLFYIMDYSGSYESYKKIESLGWLSVALVIFTLWRPHLSIIGSFVFGMLYITGARIPTLLGITMDISATPLFEMLPYVVTIVVLIVTSISKKRENQPPASLGLPYFREER